MPTYDPLEQKLCIRVVYDGAASTGKTTNVRQLANLVVAQHTTAVVSPAELCGRTLYFDWMQVSAGSICGFPLVCQVISVPGQDALAVRRRHLLSLADVVVFVADGSRKSIDETRASLATAVASLRSAGDAPRGLVIQANKQDQPDALAGAELLAALGHADTEVVEAIASDGIGVVDTFVAAVRFAARALRARAEEGAFRVPVRGLESEHELLAQLTAFEIDPYGAAELLLEQAAATYEAEMDLAPAAKTNAAIELALAAHERRPATAPTPDAPVRSAPLPTAAVPTGFVWPAHTGRGILQSLALTDHVEVDRSGASRTYGHHVFSTSLEGYFADTEAARQALVRSARERTRLGSLLVDDTVLVVQPTDTGEAWLWTVTPETEPVRDWLSHRLASRTEEVAAAVANAASVILEHGFALSPRLDAFRVQSDSVRYAGPTTKLESNDERRESGALAFLLGMISEAKTTDLPMDAFVGTIARRLHARIGGHELAKLVDASRARPGESGEQAHLIDALVRVAEAA